MSAPQPPVMPSGTPPGAPAVPAVTPYQGPYAAPYVAPYAEPVHPQFGAALASASPRRSATVGVVALVAAGIAALTPVVAAIAAFPVGLGAGKEIAMRPSTKPWNWDILTSVREWVLLGEIMFWFGTALGVWAIIQGIVAIVTRRGRRAGIVAIVIATLAALVFALATWISVGMGLTAGTSIAG